MKENCMKKIVITSLTLLLITQSQSNLLALGEPPKVELPKEHSADKQQPETQADKNYENEKTTAEPNSSTGAVTTKQEESQPPVSTGSETSISLEPTEEEEEEETFTDVLKEKGAESDVDHAQERIKEDSKEKKAQAEEMAQEMTKEQDEKVEALVENTLKELETNSSDSSKIVENAEKEMGITSLPSYKQDSIMKQFTKEWNTLTVKYQDSSIPADQLKEFFSSMYTTIQKG